jgi:hypothetical protein
LARWREVGAVSGSREPLGAKPVAAHSNSNSACNNQRLATARQYASTITYSAPTQAPGIKQSKSKSNRASRQQWQRRAQSSVGPLLASASPAANISGPAAQKSTQQQQALTSCTLCIITNDVSEQKSKPVAASQSGRFWLLPRRRLPTFLSLRRRRAHSNSRH